MFLITSLYLIYINWLSEHTYPFHLSWTWLECNRSCIEDTSHGSLAKWLIVHNWLIYLSNFIETIMHHLLIRGITCLDRQDGFSIMSALVCMIIHWTRSMMNHDIRLLVVTIYQITILHKLSTLREY